MFDCSLCGKTVDDDGAGLAYTMGTVLGLEILLRVPVAVEEDDGIGGGEVDAEATCSGTQEEQFAILPVVKRIDLFSAVFSFDAAIDTTNVPATESGGPFFQKIELAAELAEEDDFVAFGEEVRDEAVEH